MLCAFLLLVLVLPTTADKPGEPSTRGDWLMSTTVLTRHADRAAQSDPFITKSAESIFFRGGGELSTEGIANARATGESYRDIYTTNSTNNNFPFLDIRLKPTEVSFRASGLNRVLMSASAFSSGYFNDGNPVQAPVVTMTPYEADKLLGINYNCDAGWEDIKQKYKLNNSSNMGAQLLERMRATEWTCTDPPASQSDTLIAEYANSKTRTELNENQRQCAQGPASRFMYDYVEQLGGSGTNSSDARIRLQRTVGQLSNEIIDNFKKMVKCYEYSKGKFCDPYTGMTHYYHAHDVNIVAILNVFSNQNGARSFFKGFTTAFSCSLVFELWIQKETPFLKIFIKNGIDAEFEEFVFCDFLGSVPRLGRYCTLSAAEMTKDQYIDRSEPPCMIDQPSRLSL